MSIENIWEFLVRNWLPPYNSHDLILFFFWLVWAGLLLFFRYKLSKNKAKSFLGRLFLNSFKQRLNIVTADDLRENLRAKEEVSIAKKNLQFPRWFNYLYLFLILFMFAGLFVTPFYFLVVGPIIQNLLFNTGAIFLPAHGIALIMIGVISMPAWILTVGLSFEILNKFLIPKEFRPFSYLKFYYHKEIFSKKVSWDEKVKMMNEKLEKFDYEKAQASDDKTSYFFGYWLFLILGPLYLLTIGMYMNFSDSGLSINRFVSLKEDFVSYQNISRIELKHMPQNVSKSHRRYINSNLEMVIMTNGLEEKIDIDYGRDFEFFGYSSLDRTLNLLKLLKEEGVKFYTMPLNREESYLYYDSSREFKLIFKFFEESAENLKN